MSDNNSTYSLQTNARQPLPRSKRLRRLGAGAATVAAVATQTSSAASVPTAQSAPRPAGSSSSSASATYARIRSDDIRSATEYSEGTEGTGFRLWMDQNAKSNIETHRVAAREEITLAGMPLQHTEALSTEDISLICI